MAARIRWRRKLTLGDHRLLWYVADDPDRMGPVLHLFTPNKGLVLQYWLERVRGYPGLPLLIVSVRGVRRFIREAPAWESRRAATPAFVRLVAEWLLREFTRGDGSSA